MTDWILKIIICSCVGTILLLIILAIVVGPAHTDSILRALSA